MASSNSLWKPSGVEGVPPPFTASLRSSQRSLACASEPPFRSESAEEASFWRRAFWPVRERP